MRTLSVAIFILTTFAQTSYAMSCSLNGRMTGAPSYFWIFGQSAWEGSGSIVCSDDKHIPVSLLYIVNPPGSSVLPSSTINLSAIFTVTSSDQLFGYFRSVGLYNSRSIGAGRYRYSIILEPEIYQTMTFETDNNEDRASEFSNGYLRILQRNGG